MQEKLEELMRSQRSVRAHIKICSAQLQSARQVHALAVSQMSECLNETKRLKSILDKMTKTSRVKVGQELNPMILDLGLEELAQVQNLLELRESAAKAAAAELERASDDIGHKARLLDLAKTKSEAIALSLTSLKERQDEQLLEHEWLARI